jgi:uncharacterized protein with HEPN domain
MTDKKALRVEHYLEHILKAITQIEVYVEGVDQAAFLNNPMLQDATIRNLEVIGEAANNILSQDSEFEHSIRPWSFVLLTPCEMRFPMDTSQ